MDLFRRKSRVHKMKNDASYFQHHRWQLIPLLEQLCGVWPYQNKAKQYYVQLFHYLVFSSIILALINKCMEYERVNNMPMTLESILFTLLVFALASKLVLASVFKRSRQQIYERVAEHFNTMTDSEEATTLKQFADQGFRYLIIIFSCICAIVGLFDGLPVLRSFSNYYFVDGKLDVMLPLPMDYHFDHKKYWYIITLDFVLFVCSGVLVNFSHDLSFILQTHHVNALFSIVKVRLNKASELARDFEHDVSKADDANQAYSLISSAIDLHSKCLEIVDLIEETYTVNWFLILVLNAGSLGAAVHVVSTKFHDPIETVRYLFALVMVLMHFQVIFSQGQVIIDSSSSIHDACYAGNWCGLSKNSCKLLTMMMIRTSKPCRITGAQLFPLSMETYGKMLKAGLSYYTVFKT